MPINEQISDLITNTTELMDIANISKQKIDSANALMDQHISGNDPHNQYVRKVAGLVPVFTEVDEQGRPTRMITNDNNYIRDLIDISAGQSIILEISGNSVVRNSTNTATDVVNQSLFSVTLPGGLLGRNGRLSFKGSFTYTGSGSNKIIGLYLGNTLCSVELTQTGTNNTGYIDFSPCLWNKNSESVNQHLPTAINSGSINVNPVNTNINTSEDVVVEIRVRWGAAVASENITLIHGLLEITPGF